MKLQLALAPLLDAVLATSRATVVFPIPGDLEQAARPTEFFPKRLELESKLYAFAPMVQLAQMRVLRAS